MKHILARTIKPAAFPVTQAELKSDLRVQHTAEDGLIDSLIAAATDYLDVPNGAIGKALITQTWTLSIPCADRLGKIEIPVTPVQSISSITYYDADNTQQPLDVASFYLYGDEDKAWIEPKPDITWPTTYNRQDAITVTFIAGFGDASTDVPNSIRQALRLIAAHWYEHRMTVSDQTMSEVPMAAENLININRKGWAF